MLFHGRWGSDMSGELHLDLRAVSLMTCRPPLCSLQTLLSLFVWLPIETVRRPTQLKCFILVVLYRWTLKY